MADKEWPRGVGNRRRVLLSRVIEAWHECGGEERDGRTRVCKLEMEMSQTGSSQIINVESR